MSAENDRLKIYSKTWTKDSYELIDFYSKDLHEKSLEIKSSGYIYREQEKLEFSDTEIDNTEKLLTIERNEKDYLLHLNEYEIDKEYNITTPNSTWFLLRKEFMEEKMNEYNLKEGDILKIGRITIRIKMIKFSKSYNNNKSKQKTTDNNNNNNNISINTDFSQSLKEIQQEHNILKKKTEINETDTKSENKACRICYNDDESDDNPLVQPCICSGSMKYIHLNCLKTWINTSVNIKLESTEYCNVYTYKPAECELCKTQFPDFVRHKNKLYEILDFYNDFSSYLIFECLTIDKTQNRFIYVVNLDNPSNRINIGRGHNSNIILNDISVSRLHCFLNINKNAKKVFISDNNSKFGTLILVQTNTITLSLELNLFLQIGRSYLQMILKRPMSLFGCCGISEKKNSDFYYLQNYDKHKFETKLTVKTEGDCLFDDNICETKNEIQDNGLMKTKINLMDEKNDNNNNDINDLEGLLLTTPETKVNNNEKDLIDDDNNNNNNDNGIPKNNIDDDESIVINDDENSNMKNIGEINGNGDINNNIDNNI